MPSKILSTSDTPLFSHIKLRPANRRPISLCCGIHSLGIPMISTAFTTEPFTRINPCPHCGVLEPALLALIFLPAFETYASLKKRPRRPGALQNGHESSAKSAVRMIVVNLICGALLEPSYNVVEAASVRLGFFGRRIKGALNP